MKLLEIFAKYELMGIIAFITLVAIMVIQLVVLQSRNKELFDGIAKRINDLDTGGSSRAWTVGLIKFFIMWPYWSLVILKVWNGIVEAERESQTPRD